MDARRVENVAAVESFTGAERLLDVRSDGDDVLAADPWPERDVGHQSVR